MTQNAVQSATDPVNTMVYTNMPLDKGKPESWLSTVSAVLLNNGARIDNTKYEILSYDDFHNIRTNSVEDLQKLQSSWRNLDLRRKELATVGNGVDGGSKVSGSELLACEKQYTGLILKHSRLEQQWSKRQEELLKHYIAIFQYLHLLIKEDSSFIKPLSPDDEQDQIGKLERLSRILEPLKLKLQIEQSKLKSTRECGHNPSHEITKLERLCNDLTLERYNVERRILLLGQEMLKHRVAGFLVQLMDTTLAPESTLINNGRGDSQAFGRSSPHISEIDRSGSCPPSVSELTSSRENPTAKLPPYDENTSKPKNNQNNLRIAEESQRYNVSRAGGNIMGEHSGFINAQQTAILPTVGGDKVGGGNGEDGGEDLSDTEYDDGLSRTSSPELGKLAELERRQRLMRRVVNSEDVEWQLTQENRELLERLQQEKESVNKLQTALDQNAQRGFSEDDPMKAAIINLMAQAVIVRGVVDATSGLPKDLEESVALLGDTTRSLAKIVKIEGAGGR
ncbi:hypothetical protein VCV18_012526 [Metarhizium anisopliae]